MRWFKKIVRAILALLPVFAVFLIPSSNTSALQHDYKGYYVSDVIMPTLGSDNKVDFTTADPSGAISNNLSVTFSNDYLLDFNVIRPYSFNNYYQGYYFTFNNGICSLVPSGDGTYHFIPGLSYLSYSNYSQLRVSSFHTLSTNYQIPANSVNNCFLSSHYQSYPISFDSNSNFRLYNTLDSYNGGYLNSVDSLSVFSNDIYPYPFTADGLKLHDTTVSSNTGQTYSHSFAFSRLWTGPTVNKFRSLVIPLFTHDGYFLNSDNLYNGRSLEWKFLFNFPGSFAWNSDLSNGEISIRAIGYDLGGNSRDDKLTDCTANLIQVSSGNQLEISCPVTLERNWSYLIPVLYIYNDPYVWDSNQDFEFYSTYLITDNDTTPGQSFNDDFVGKMWDATQGVDGDNSCNPNDYWCNLNNLFNFQIPINNTPIGGILGNFSDQSSCASIPTIAGMIHSNETQVCPWFSSTVRSIATPVLSLFSVCFVFGFIVRWLKSSSGDNMLNSHKNGDKD